jgi:hypothetical protein
MHFSKIALVLPLILSVAVAVPAPVADDAAEGGILEPRGFGCPDDSKCNKHVNMMLDRSFFCQHTADIHLSARASKAEELADTANIKCKCTVFKANNGIGADGLHQRVHLR